MASLNLSGVALVTGASKGIGRAICLAFAVSGVRGLVLSGRNQDDLQAAATDAQVLATNPEFAFLVVPGDVGVEADIINLMSKSVEHFGRIDYAVNNAGFIAQKFRAFADVPTEELDALTNINQRGTFLCTREEIKAMKKQDLQDAKGITATAPKVERGSIVNISSAAALSPLAYSALDHAVDGIRVNCVLPGYTMTEGFAAHPDATPELAAYLVSKAPMKRLATADEVADAVIFLSSPLARYITGASLVVDGGQSLVVL